MLKKPLLSYKELFMKYLFKIINNIVEIHYFPILSGLIILFTLSNADALMIQVENLTEIPQTGIALGSDEPPVDSSPSSNISDADFVINLLYGKTLLSGNEPYLEDRPEIAEGMAIDYYSFLGSPNYMNGPVITNNIIDMSTGSFSIEVGSNNPNYDRVRLTFLPSEITPEAIPGVIPEPASILLLGSGIMGLYFLRK